MYLSIGAIFLVVYALSTVQCSTYFARAVDDFDDNGDSAAFEEKVVEKRSVSLTLKGKAALERLLQGSIKLEPRSTPIFRRYDKKGNWETAKNDFRAVADKGTVRARADRTGRRVTQMTGKAGDRHLVLIRDGYNGNPTLQLIDDLLHTNHIDEFIYMKF